MSRYVYISPKSYTVKCVATGVALIAMGIFLIRSNFELGIRFSSTSMGEASKVVWGLFALAGLVSVCLGIASMFQGRRDVIIDSDSITVPANQWTKAMVTLQPEQIRKLEVYKSPDDPVTLRIKHGRRSSRLFVSHFESVNDFWACSNRIAKFADKQFVFPQQA